MTTSDVSVDVPPTDTSAGSAEPLSLGGWGWADGNDHSWAATETISIVIDLLSTEDLFNYPSVLLEVTHPDVTIAVPEFNFFGIFAGEPQPAFFQVTAGSAMAAGTTITFNARPTYLNCGEAGSPCPDVPPLTFTITTGQAPAIDCGEACDASNLADATCLSFDSCFGACEYANPQWAATGAFVLDECLAVVTYCDAGYSATDCIEAIELFFCDDLCAPENYPPGSCLTQPTCQDYCDTNSAGWSTGDTAQFWSCLSARSMCFDSLADCMGGL